MYQFASFGVSSLLSILGIPNAEMMVFYGGLRIGVRAAHSPSFFTLSFLSISISISFSFLSGIRIALTLVVLPYLHNHLLYYT